MSERYNRAKRILKQDPATLLRRSEARYLYLCQKKDIDCCMEAFDKRALPSEIKYLRKIVNSYEKKIN
ncbi:Hypothetical protein BRZCDTV_275 [Brazilian cedratvirus IHUMI]|uniref:Uncharacterized protein n=1 Tax=Brazilian cedratvirus IHUMI TaxID=2126980 RepID=A0A2R8FE88_9VIRU|nr:Hypothetical protein BRZCDTV_275 [Brazilian cedratvirus IHUMI]